MTEIIRVENGRLLVDGYETTDEEIVSYFDDIPPENIENRFTTSLKVGVVALKTIGTTEKIDYVEKEFFKLRQKFNEGLTEALDSVEDEINSILGKEGTFTQQMNDHLGEEGTLSTKIDEFFGEDGKIMKEIFDPTKEGTPFYLLRSLLTEEIGRIRSELIAKEAEERARAETPLKGYAFEDLCEVFLSDIVRTRFGDELTRTTTETGSITGSFKGDFVITLIERPDCRIVLETKDIGNITLPEIHRTMETSIKNRDATYGIFISKWVEALPRSVGCFNEYSGNHLVCALTSHEHEELRPEILNIAVCWARNRALLEKVRAEGIDIPLIQSRLEEIQGKLGLFARIKTECTNAQNAFERINGFVKEIQEGIELELTNIRNEIIRVLGKPI